MTDVKTREGFLRVWPASKRKGELIKHPTAGAFRPQDDENGAEWPDDAFTHNRLRDGDIVLEKPDAQSEDNEPAPQPNLTDVSPRKAR